MSDQITTAAELDALPLCAHCGRPIEQGLLLGTQVWMHVDSGTEYCESVKAVLAPARTDPTEEQVRQAIETALGATWDSAVEQHLDDAARAVLALLPQRVAPSEEEVAGLLADLMTAPRATDVHRGFARSVQKLYASQPTVAEVRAQALKDAADDANLAWLEYRPNGWGSNAEDQEALNAFLWALKWLRARAERGEA